MDELLKKGFKYANIGIAFVDEQGNFEIVNPFCTKLTGYTEEELLKMNYKDLCSEMNAEPDDEYFNKLISGETDHYELEKKCTDKNGEDMWVHLVASRLEVNKGERPMIMRLTQDITDRKKSEAEVNKLNQLMVDRELKMVELKKEIERLKSAQ